MVNPEHGATTADFVRRAHSLKGPHGKPLKVWPWTVNTPSRARHLRDIGVDGFTSDLPDAMRRALGG